MSGHHIKSLTAILYAGPAFLLMMFIYVIPAASSVRLSLYTTQGLSEEATFVAFDNYAEVFADPRFWQVALQTVIWVLALLMGTLLLSFMLGLLLNERFRGWRSFRVLVLAPAATSLALLATVWRFAFEPDGHINHTLSGFSSSPDPMAWLADTPQAFVAIVVVGILVTVPFMSLMLAAAMRSLDRHIYEAALLDGAGAFRRAISITLPLIRPMMLIVTMATFIGAFNSFSIIFVMTGGGPANRTDTIATYLYDEAFTFLNFGRAAAITVVALLVLAAISVPYVHQMLHQTENA